MRQVSPQGEARDPRPLFRWLRRSLLLLGTIYFVLLLISVFSIALRLRTGFAAPADQFLLFIAYTQIANIVFFICSITLSAWLTYRTMSNVHRLKGSGNRITPLWSIAWYLVPIANLVMPPKAVWQIWIATFGEGPVATRRAITIPAWWLAAVASILCHQAALYLLIRDGVRFGQMMLGDFISPAQYALGILAIYFFIRTFDYISRGQSLLLQRASADTFD